MLFKPPLFLNHQQKIYRSKHYLLLANIIKVLSLNCKNSKTDRNQRNNITDNGKGNTQKWNIMCIICCKEEIQRNENFLLPRARLLQRTECSPPITNPNDSPRFLSLSTQHPYNRLPPCAVHSPLLLPSTSVFPFWPFLYF